MDFYSFYDRPVDIHILTRSQSRVSDTQVTVKTRGSLVYLTPGQNTVFLRKEGEGQLI